VNVRNAPSILVFDVNETLIDIESIGPFFEKKFGDRRVLREWFNQLILYSSVITLAGYYQTFFALGQGVLEMLVHLRRHGKRRRPGRIENKYAVDAGTHGCS
jgi:2-haloacid dehalogenase